MSDKPRLEKILAVDDEPRVLRLVSEVLRAGGYRVVAASSAESAIDLLVLEQPDLGGEALRG